MSSAETRQRLQNAVLATLREQGIAGLSARLVAHRAGVNQALIFYHYDALPKLVEAAALSSVASAVDRYRAAIEATATFAELFAVGQQIDADERMAGNVAVMAQLVAGSQLDPAIASCARACLDEWILALEPTVGRLLDASPLRDLVDHRGLVRLISSAFIGLELYESVDTDGASIAVAALEQLSALVEAIETLGPVAHRAVRTHMRRRTRRANRPATPTNG